MKHIGKIILGSIALMLAVSGGIVYGDKVTANDVYACDGLALDMGTDIQGHQKIEGHVGDVDYVYSDAYLEHEPSRYDQDMAAMSEDLNDADANVPTIYSQIGMQNQMAITISEAKQSVAYTIASKPVYIHRVKKESTLVVITIETAETKSILSGIEDYLKIHGLEDDLEAGDVTLWIIGNEGVDTIAKDVIAHRKNHNNEVYAYYVGTEKKDDEKQGIHSLKKAQNQNQTQQIGEVEEDTIYVEEAGSVIEVASITIAIYPSLVQEGVTSLDAVSDALNDLVNDEEAERLALMTLGVQTVVSKVAGSKIDRIVKEDETKATVTEATKTSEETSIQTSVVAKIVPSGEANLLLGHSPPP